eukprot:5889887-Pleurochrysis_carterae.AAC.5
MERGYFVLRVLLNEACSSASTILAVSLKRSCVCAEGPTNSKYNAMPITTVERHCVLRHPSPQQYRVASRNHGI